MNKYEIILNKLKNGENASKIVDLVIEQVLAGKELLRSTSKIFKGGYIYSHYLNVCILAVTLGLKVKLSSQRLKSLGLLAIGHADTDDALDKEVLNKRKLNKLSKEIFRLVDVYDALTHPPVYRNTMTSFEVLTSIMNTNKFFDRTLVKILLEELTLYPRGSWVQLSTREIARVIAVNRELLLRPIVEVVLDWKGKSSKKKKEIDLSRNHFIYILRPLTEKEVVSFSKIKKGRKRNVRKNSFN